MHLKLNETVLNIKRKLSWKTPQKTKKLTPPPHTHKKNIEYFHSNTRSVIKNYSFIYNTILGQSKMKENTIFKKKIYVKLSDNVGPLTLW